tara:strand:- start:579 stop:968 length:390 start_codon:yes stop_codon:yes gene_type:complete
MAVTEANIRDVLNRPRGLLSGTITEFINMRTAQVNKVARGSLYIGSSSSNIVSDTEKESAIKALVAVDCLNVLIDSIPSYVPKDQQRSTDIRLRAQLSSFEERAQQLLDLIKEAGGSAFATGKTSTRQE